MSVLVGLF